jgi:hypothetical protein
MVKTNFDRLMQEIYSFEKNAGFDKTSKPQIAKWLKEELANYRKAKTKLIKQNKLMDIIILVMQIARRENMSLDEAWIKWHKKSKKYLKRNLK